jgi:Domain of unknown function (DUF4386)
MSSIRNEGMTLPQAALVVGFTYLFNPVTYAEYVYPKLVIPGNIEQTTQNISVHGGLFLAAVFCYLISFIGDVVLAWALYVLLAPVNRSLSLLTAWFQLVYAAIALFGTLNLVTAFRLLNTPEYLTAFGTAQMRAQLLLLLNSFRYDWSMGLVLFGIHLVLLGYLICRSSYIPRIIGILLVIDGLGWMTDSLSPYLFPKAHFKYISITFFGELVFMLWLLIRGWKIKLPAAGSGVDSLIVST